FKENIELNCDPILLEKVFTAIIKNAIVYNKNEGSLIIETKKFSNKLEISFQDSGIGIADEFFEKIFERFFRIDSSLTYEVSGVGLGLFIAKKLIFMHSGSINIKSEIKNGSEFLISIPL
ncbi:MAG: ATP-binding protein, partial [Leptospiraceae bacterium]|nr:ATP-binding protein [Leptospiraceae bacterium]